MKNEPTGLTPETICAALDQHWGIGVAHLTYAPLGFGSYHWLADDAGGRRWFVTADQLAPHGHYTATDAAGVLATLDAAYQTAATLQRAGLDCVLAPVAGRDGALVHEVVPGWALAVFPFVDGKPAGDWRWTDLETCREAATIVGRIHAFAPPAVAPVWDPAIPHRATLSQAFDDLGAPWQTGPYAEDTRRLLAASRTGVEALFRHYATLVEALLADDAGWVLSHGEPHSANFLRAASGQLYLIDWDTVRLAPRERDLAGLPLDDAGVRAAYESTAGPQTPRPWVIELFRHWWTLSEICCYVAVFRAPHGDGPDEQLSRRELENYLNEVKEWQAKRGPSRTSRA